MRRPAPLWVEGSLISPTPFDGLRSTNIWAWRFPYPVLNPNGGNGNSDGLMRVIASWPSRSREVALQIAEQYGMPDEATPTRLTWYNRGPWRRTVVSAIEVPHDWPKPHVDVLEQTIFYRVPPSYFTPLAEFDGSVFAERTKGILSARCDNEAMNFLAINLAHDIVSGQRSVEEARRFYEETALAYMAGERPAYVRGLIFEPPAGHTGDLDIPAF